LNLDNLLFDAELFFPFICLLISVFIFYKNRLPSNGNRKIKILAGIGILLPILILIIYWTVAIDFGDAAFILIIFLSILALILGIFLFFMPFRYLKIFGFFLGVIFPVLMFLTLHISNDFSSNAMTVKDGNYIAAALDQFKQDKGYYPQLLRELVPDYVARFKHPKNISWQYSSTGQEFSLGYVFYVDKIGYSVRLISSNDRKWTTLENYSTGPFEIGPTPYPDATPDW
jgi:hypothetical protein